MRELVNQRIREYARERNVTLWMIAESLHVSEPTMSRKMRKELAADETERILNIIDELSGSGSV